MRKSINNNKEKWENEEYFDLKKEMGLNIKNKKKKNNLSVNIYETFHNLILVIIIFCKFWWVDSDK